MASNKLYKPGQLITVKCKERTMLCRVTKRSPNVDVCKECVENNDIGIAMEICENLKCNMLGFNNYPKLVKKCKKV